IRPSLTALEAGVHVLQEKPLAHTLTEGQRLVDALAAATSSAAAGTSPAASEGSASAGLTPAASEGSAALPAAPKVGICFRNRYTSCGAAGSWAPCVGPGPRWCGRAPSTTTARSRGAAPGPAPGAGC